MVGRTLKQIFKGVYACLAILDRIKKNDRFFGTLFNRKTIIGWAVIAGAAPAVPLTGVHRHPWSVQGIPH